VTFSLFSSYRYVVIQDKRRYGPFRLGRALRAVRRRVRTQDADHYLMAVNGKLSKIKRDLFTTINRLEERLRRNNLGVVYTVYAMKDSAIQAKVRVRVVGKMPEPSDVPGTPAVKVWVGYLKEYWPRARLAGTCVCKPGDHGDCAACDDFDTPANMEDQRDFAIQFADELKVKYVILYDRIWTRGPPYTSSSQGFHPYRGTYHSHVHVSFTDGVKDSAC